MISDSAASKVRRSESLSAGVSSGALLPSGATNVWVVGASANDVPALSSLGRMVRTVDTTTDALPPRMVRTYSGF
jgi:hypothetical protein